MYGNKVASDEIDDAGVLSPAISFGTIAFNVGAVWTGTFTIASDCQITGIYAASSTGSPTVLPVGITQSGTTATWVSTAGSAGTISYICVYVKKT